MVTIGAIREQIPPGELFHDDALTSPVLCPYGLNDRVLAARLHRQVLGVELSHVQDDLKLRRRRMRLADFVPDGRTWPASAVRTMNVVRVRSVPALRRAVMLGVVMVEAELGVFEAPRRPGPLRVSRSDL